VDGAEAAVLHPGADDWRGGRHSRHRQDPGPQTSVRRDDDVRLLRLPLSRRIKRGFYEDGIWADTSFIAYNEVGGISWREGEHQVTLIVISRLRNLARRLAVPIEHYGAARRLLRDKIAAHDIHFFGTGLDLGEHDERDEV